VRERERGRKEGRKAGWPKLEGLEGVSYLFEG